MLGLHRVWAEYFRSPKFEWPDHGNYWTVKNGSIFMISKSVNKCICKSILNKKYVWRMHFKIT